jgi:hypothetical protein
MYLLNGNDAEFAQRRTELCVYTCVYTEVCVYRGMCSHVQSTTRMCSLVYRGMCVWGYVLFRVCISCIV